MVVLECTMGSNNMCVLCSVVLAILCDCWGRTPPKPVPSWPWTKSAETLVIVTFGSDLLEPEIDVHASPKCHLHMDASM